MNEDTKIFLTRCYNLATHFNSVKKDLIEPNNALHEKISYFCDAFLTPELLTSLSKVIRDELHDLQAAQVHILAAQTLPLLAEISDVFYRARWSSEDVGTAQRYLFSVADKLIFENATQKITAKEFLQTHLDEINKALKNTDQNKKEFLDNFARKHGHVWDESHLLREYNDLNVKGANKVRK